MDDDQKDTLTLIVVGVVFLMGGGLTMVASKVMPSLQAFLADAGLLVPAEDAVFAIADTGTGPSALAALGVLGILGLLIVLAPALRRSKDGER